jgi:acyl-CoA synthetase (AMP-forming)/AMP-acid ligase II
VKIIIENDSVLENDVEQVVESTTHSRPLVLATSGTTGAPKTIHCELVDALARKRGGKPTEIWLLTYSPRRWAGVSVILHVIKSDSLLVVPKSLGFSDVIQAGCANQITHISLTPSMFRNLLLHDEEKRLIQMPVSQVTFGGEASTQSVLDLAAQIWPKARITHVYASTEFGDICAVSDGLEGIPVEKFSSYSLNDEGELFIEGCATGDIWELRGNRYYSLGRREEIINVGGNKVSPLVIEEFALRHGAKFARVYGVPSGLMGFVVGLDYVGDIGRLELQKQFRQEFPKYMCPAVIQQVSEISLSGAGKIKRLS